MQPLRLLLQHARDLSQQLLPLLQLPASKLRARERRHLVHDEEPHAVVDERLLEAVEPLQNLR